MFIMNILNFGCVDDLYLINKDNIKFQPRVQEMMLHDSVGLVALLPSLKPQNRCIEIQ